MITISEKERITLLIDEETKLKWQKFKEKNKIPSISELIRDCVNFYIDSEAIILHLKDFSKVSHDLKEPLTSIKGFSQIIIDSYSDKLDSNLLSKIKEIYTQSLFLENKINMLLNEITPETSQYEYDILIIEDDIPTINVLVEFFSLKGYKSKGVNSGAKGLEEINTTIPKLILLDILLPDIDGYEVCKKLKSNEKLKKVPIFYITAVPASEVNKQLKETGAEGFFLKPFNLDEFQILYDYL